MNWDNPEECAKKFAGNWRKFDSFGWHHRPDDAERFAIFYTHNRDSTLLDLSNAEQIRLALAPFLEEEKDVFSEHHGHWGCGWVDGYSIRCVDDAGNVTPAFRTYCELRARLADYPVLDESHYSQMEYDATCDSIREAGRRFVAEDAPEDWPQQCFSWFWDNDQGAVENRDDQGGYPSAEQMRQCLADLGWLDAEYATETAEEA